MYTRQLFALAFATGVAYAESIPHYDNWAEHGQDWTCGFACQTALNAISIQDTTPEDSRTLICGNQLRTKSIYECMDLYCSPEQIQPAAAYINNWCQGFGFVSLTPYDNFSHSLSDGELRQKALADEKLWDEISVSLEPVNRTIIPYPAKYQIIYKTVATFYWNHDNSIMYGWAMYVFWGVVVAISMITKMLDRLTQRNSGAASSDPEGKRPNSASQSFIARCKLNLNRLIFTPATFGKHSLEPYGWCTVPPLIETLTIVSFIVINVVLCAINYEAFYGNTYYPNNPSQISRYLSDRTGIIAFANLPILWLFAQRNNILVWLVGWSPDTFNHFHRWIARLVVVESVVHAIVRTVWEFQRGGFENYALQWEYRWWRLGVVAVITICIMSATSLYGLRARAYDVFLFIHFNLALLFLVSIFYHAKVYVNHEWDGYLWACAVIWCLDRLLRIGRITFLNLFRSKSAVAYYSESSQLINLEVPVNPSVAAAKGSYFYVYVLHGPTMFQSHPFTASYAVSTQHGKISTLAASESSQSLDPITEKEGKHDAQSASSGSSNAEAEVGGFYIDYSTLRFYIRPYNGFTRRLRDRLANEKVCKPLSVLIEGPYGIQRTVHRFDNVFFVISGSGITVALQYLQSLARRKQLGKPVPYVHVLWVIRHPTLVRDFDDELKMYSRLLEARVTVHITAKRSFPLTVEDSSEKVEDTGSKTQGEISTRAGVAEGRPDVNEYVVKEREARNGTLAVVSCSPPAMADDTRQAVVNAMKSTQQDVKFIPESFSW